jgi:hypothetical protein
MKRTIITIAALAAFATPALAQNTPAENDVAGAAVMFVTSSYCKLTAADSARLKAMADKVISSNGWTWDELRNDGRKPIIGYFLKEYPVYERMQAGDKVAIDSMCGALRAALASGALK